MLRKRPASALLNQSALLKMSMAKRCMRYPKIGWISLSYILYLLTSKASNATYFRKKPHIGGGNRASSLHSDTHIATVRAAPIADFFFFKFQIKLACTYSKDNTARSLARSPSVCWLCLLCSLSVCRITTDLLPFHADSSHLTARCTASFRMEIKSCLEQMHSACAWVCVVARTHTHTRASHEI